jgi:hypothetical protein
VLRDVSYSNSVITLRDASCSSSVVTLRDASCSSASLHRYSSTLPSPSLQSSRVSCGVVTSRLPSVGRLPSTDFHPRTTSVHGFLSVGRLLSTDFRPSDDFRLLVLSSYVLHLDVMLS